MKALVLDIETTGFMKKSNKADVVEFASQLIDTTTGDRLGAIEKRFRPTAPIEPDAEAVHGISAEMVSGCQPFEKFIAPLVELINLQVDVLVAHNASFDVPFLKQVIQRFKPECDLELVPTFCTMEEGRWATYDGKSPTLGELCYACSVDYDRDAAHAALYDVEKTVECLNFGRHAGFYDLSSLKPHTVSVSKAA